MNGNLWELAVASAAFVGSHMALSGRAVRPRLIGTLGEWPFRALYTAVSLATFVWMFKAFANAPFMELWPPMKALDILAVAVMLPVCILLVSGLTTASPSGIALDLIREGPDTGILKITRQPVMWGVGLWALAHMAVNGDIASLIFFGALAVLALAGAAMLDRRKKAAGGERWLALQAETSFLPFAAILDGRAKVTLSGIGWWRIGVGIALFVILFYFHGRLFGVSLIS
ncbi:MAG TPA: NnrU protein [Alphaproteobacteria bacterium]|nr:NnrU protein [Alphaproteobacteria bacterium]